MALRSRRRQRGQEPTSASRLLVDLTAFRIAAALVVIGVGLLFLAAEIEGPEVSAAIDSTVRELGALLFAAGILSVFWELLGRRALTKELLDAARLSADVQNAGLGRKSGWLSGFARSQFDALWTEASVRPLGEDQLA